MNSKSAFSSRNLLAAALAAAVLWICLFSGLSAIGLVGPDEPRYAWIARNMAESGNWVTPILYGRAWFEKPILYYWTAAAGFKLLHSPEWAARLPSSLAALAAVLGMAWLAWRRYGTSTAWAVFMILPTCIGFVAFSRAATPDMVFSASLALALLSAATVAERNSAFAENAEIPRKSDRTHLMLLGVWLGIATLAKGPAALLLAGGSVCLWALATKKWKIAFRMLHPFSILSFCVVALPWYVLCSYRNPEFFRTFILLNNFERYLTPVFQHKQPFWYFGPITLIGMLPWTALLVCLAIDGRRIWRDKSYAGSFGLFAACWVIFPALFFSFSDSKLPGYILPAFPPLALLLAHSFVRAMDRAPRIAQWTGVATGVMWVVLGVAGAASFRRINPTEALPSEAIHALILTVAFVGLLAGVLMEWASKTRKFWLVLTLSACLSAALVACANAFVLPRIDTTVSARNAARLWNSSAETVSVKLPTLLLGVNRDCEYGLAFYVGHIPEEWTPNAPRPSLLLVGPAGEKKIESINGAQPVSSAGAQWPPCGTLYHLEPPMPTAMTHPTEEGGARRR